jgi:hypothetical protein
MSATKTPASPKNYSYEEVRRKAFGSADHPVTLADLRVAAYAAKANKGFPPEIESHLRSCGQCQREFDMIRRTDPLLTGEDSRLRVLIHSVGDAATAEQIANQGHRAISAAVGQHHSLAAAAATLWKSVRSSLKD